MDTSCSSLEKLYKVLVITYKNKMPENASDSNNDEILTTKNYFVKDSPNFNTSVNYQTAEGLNK